MWFSNSFVFTSTDHIMISKCRVSLLLVIVCILVSMSEIIHTSLIKGTRYFFSIIIVGSVRVFFFQFKESEEWFVFEHYWFVFFRIVEIHQYMSRKYIYWKKSSIRSVSQIRLWSFIIYTKSLKNISRRFVLSEDVLTTRLEIFTIKCIELWQYLSWHYLLQEDLY